MADSCHVLSWKTNLYWSRLKLGSPLLLMTGITETGLEIDFIDLLRLTGKAGFSPTCKSGSSIKKKIKVFIPVAFRWRLILLPALAVCSLFYWVANIYSSYCLYFSQGICFQSVQSEQKVNFCILKYRNIIPVHSRGPYTSAFYLTMMGHSLILPSASLSH